MNKKSSVVLRWQIRIYQLSILVLIVSGLGQMPLFKRYAVSDIPGMAWTADFYVQHVLHYLGASVFLFLVLQWAAFFPRFKRSYSLTLWGWLRVSAVVLIIGSGFFRVLKNLPSWSFSPEATMVIGWSHLAAAMLFGLLALTAKLSGNATYLIPKK
ncbi:MAG TPA: FeS-binding protein [Desulfonatronum sp.]|nr:FeS-binding protein [Desulfonatronum sp.]